MNQKLKEAQTTLNRITIPALLILDKNIKYNNPRPISLISFNIPIRREIREFLNSFSFDTSVLLNNIIYLADKLPETDFESPQTKRFKINTYHLRELNQLSQEYGIKLNDLIFIILCQQLIEPNTNENKFYGSPDGLVFNLRIGDLSILSALGLEMEGFYDKKDEISELIDGWF